MYDNDLASGEEVDASLVGESGKIDYEGEDGDENLEDDYEEAEDAYDDPDVGQILADFAINDDPKDQNWERER